MHMLSPKSERKGDYMLNWKYYNYAKAMLDADEHILIGGMSGSGKSYLIGELMHTALCKSPSEISFMIADPKRVDMMEYQNIPHIIEYEQTPKTILQMLKRAHAIMEQRYSQMERQHLKMWQGGKIYIIVDELLDLMQSTEGKAIQRELLDLLCLGRASKVLVISATQSVHRTALGMLPINFQFTVALHTKSSTDSRMLIGQSGAELLPKYGKAIFSNRNGIYVQDILSSPAEDKQDRLNWWLSQKKRRA